MKIILFVLAICLFFAPTSTAQQKQDAEDRNKKIVELNKDIDKLTAEIQLLTEKKAILEKERNALVSTFNEEIDLQSAPAVVVTRIRDSQSVTVIQDGAKRDLDLHGIVVPLANISKVTQFLTVNLLNKPFYLRCLNELCSEGYLYPKREGESINTQLVRLGFATKTPQARFELAKADLPSLNTFSASPSASNPGTSSRSTPGTEVYVHGYYRKDGTYVQPHTRSAPGRKKP